MDIPQLCCPLIHWWAFYLLWIMRLNICISLRFWLQVFWYMLRSKLLDHMVCNFIFSFFKELVPLDTLKTPFSTMVVTILHSHRQCTRVPISPYLHQTICFLNLFANGHLYEWIWDSISFTLMINDVEYLFMHLLVIHISSGMSKFFDKFLVGFILLLLLLSCRSLYIF